MLGTLGGGSTQRSNFFNWKWFDRCSKYYQDFQPSAGSSVVRSQNSRAVTGQIVMLSLLAYLGLVASRARASSNRGRPTRSRSPEYCSSDSPSKIEVAGSAQTFVWADLHSNAAVPRTEYPPAQIYATTVCRRSSCYTSHSH